MRTLTEKEIKEITNIFSDTALFGNVNVSIKQENNKILIEISDIDYAEKFKEYLNTLEDDIFIAACEYYTNITGKDLSKIKTITPSVIEGFKECVRRVVHDKIKALKLKYGI